jgi:hypothetical protein
MNVSVHDVRHALNELSRLRFGEMRVEDAMHQVVQTTHAIFSVDGAGLMLADADHHLRNAAVSDARIRHLEDLQIQHQEGPCIAAFEDKALVGPRISPWTCGGPPSAGARCPAGCAPCWPAPFPTTRTRWA